MKPEQYIAEQVKAELALLEQKTDKAKLFARRFFISISILMFISPLAGVIFVPGVNRFIMALLMVQGLMLLSSFHYPNKKRALPKD